MSKSERRTEGSETLWRHIDLFSGIGGFAYAAKQVWGEEYETVCFCDIDRFCQALLKLRFPGVPIYGDIAELIADTDTGERQKNEISAGRNTTWNGIDLFTGGFPCQPFSHAGKRRGKDDSRYLWPAMLQVIRNTRPKWVIGENVYGIVSMSDGMVFQQVCLDLEAEGYQVWPVIIPACAVNAPHRRDRVWFIAHNTNQPQLQRRGLSSRIYKEHSNTYGSSDWEKPWPEVVTKLCGVDDGLPAELDGLKLSKSKHREERLKSLGNSIVPQVAMKIMEAIKEQTLIRHAFS